MRHSFPFVSVVAVGASVLLVTVLVSSLGYITTIDSDSTTNNSISKNDIGSITSFNNSPKDPSSSSTTSSSSCYPKMGLRPVKLRDEIGSLLQEHGFKTGVEVGVKKGEFARVILDKWTSCVSYKLVDLWEKQENYKDIANVESNVHEEYYKETLSRLEPYKDKIEIYRMYSTEAAKKIQPNSLDFAYIDARHDYCGAMDDLKAYWPLVKPGGIMAGHDYTENSEVRGQDWGLCQDGTRNEMAVKGAVNDFFLPKGLTITVTRERNFVSWLVQKPLC